MYSTIKTVYLTALAQYLMRPTFSTTRMTAAVSFMKAGGRPATRVTHSRRQVEVKSSKGKQKEKASSETTRMPGVGRKEERGRRRREDEDEGRRRRRKGGRIETRW